MPADLPALAARLREAESGRVHAGLLTDLFAALFGDDFRKWPDVKGDPLTSIDSIVALIHAAEPTLSFNLSYRPPGRWWVEMWPTDRALEAEVGDIAGGALALCLALVEWRIAHGGA